MSWTPNLTHFFPLRKAWFYLRMRVATVALLWCSAAGFLKAISWFVESVSTGPHVPLKILSLNVFSDYRLIVILALSVLTVAGALSVILMNVTPNKNDQAWVLDFIARLWDEVSSASTHAGAVLVSAQIFFSKDAWDSAASREHWLVICLYLSIGYFACRDDSTNASTAAAHPQPPIGPLQPAAPSSPVPQSSTPGTP